MKFSCPPMSAHGGEERGLETWRALLHCDTDIGANALRRLAFTHALLLDWTCPINIMPSAYDSASVELDDALVSAA